VPAVYYACIVLCLPLTLPALYLPAVSAPPTKINRRINNLIVKLVIFAQNLLIITHNQYELRNVNYYRDTRRYNVR
jgi:hypothetical protein